MLEFDLGVEIEEGLFIVVLALNPESENDDQGGPIWVAKVVEVTHNEQSHKTFIALWYEPEPMKSLSRKFTLKQLYEGCLQTKREWIPNKDNLSHSMEVSGIVHCWKSRT